MGIENSTKVIPDGRPKSGRVWKMKQKERFSANTRKGVLSHLKKTYEERKRLREQLDNTKMLEKRMKEEKKQKEQEAKELREERKKRRMANEYKNSQYQVINPEKLKNMSKKQLRMIKKTSMNKNGQVELVNPWSK